MERLLAYQGPVVHVDHSHRRFEAAPTGYGRTNGFGMALARARQAQIYELEQNVLLLEAKIKELGGQVEDARTKDLLQKIKQKMCAKKVGNLQVQVAELKKIVNKVKADAKSELAAAEARLLVVKEEVQKAEQEVTSLRVALKAAQAEVAEEDVEIARLNESLEAEKKLREQREAEASALEEREKGLLQEAEKLKEMVRETTAQLETAQAATAQLQAEHGTLQAEHGKLKAEHVKLKAELTSQKDLVSKGNRENQELQRSMDKLLEDKARELAASVEEKDRTIAETQKLEEGYIKKLSELQQQVKAAETKAREAGEEVKRLTKENQLQRNGLAGYEEDIRRLQDQLASGSKLGEPVAF